MSPFAPDVVEEALCRGRRWWRRRRLGQGAEMGSASRASSRARRPWDSRGSSARTHHLGRLPDPHFFGCLRWSAMALCPAAANQLSSSPCWRLGLPPGSGCRGQGLLGPGREEAEKERKGQLPVYPPPPQASENSLALTSPSPSACVLPAPSACVLSESMTASAGVLPGRRWRSL